MSSFAAWWEELRAAALVGTARRTPPAPPTDWPHDETASTEDRLLDAAAVGGAMVRAGRLIPRAGDAVLDPATDDTLLTAPRRAVQLLQLVLLQPPAGRRLRPPLVEAWLRAAIRTGHRIPHDHLPAVFDLATARKRLRPIVLQAADTRGRWLLDLNPDWRFDADQADGTADDDLADWATRPIGARVAAVSRLRESDPTRARQLITASWQTENAGDRLELINSLLTGLGPDDEPFLEEALDDRSRPVREAAQELLSAFPASARAARMAGRLRALIEIKGRLRRTIEIKLPDDPDPSAVRDGLGRIPHGGSQRSHWLRTIIATAPLSVWTDISGRDPERSLEMIIASKINVDDVRAGLASAALAQRDQVWAKALLRAGGSVTLLPLLADADISEVGRRVLTRITNPHDLARVIELLPPPWSPDLSGLVLSEIDRVDQSKGGGRVVQGAASLLEEVLAAGLDRSVLPELQRRSEHLPTTHCYSRLVQYFTFLSAIEEAFR